MYITDEAVVEMAYRRQYSILGLTVTQLLVGATGEPREYCEAAISRAAGRGLVRCQPDARQFCQPTAAGLALLTHPY